MAPLAPSPRWIALLGLPGLWVALLGVFTVKVARAGLPHTERVRRAGGISLGWFLLEFGYWTFRGLTRLLVAIGLSPNQVTWLTLPFSIAAAVAFAGGSFGLGGWLFIASAILDSLDGQVARARRSSSISGELWDAIADRYCESFAFAGLAIYYRASVPLLLLVLAAWSGATLVSYARAKADASGVDCGSGPMQRHERSAYLGMGAVLAPLFQMVAPSLRFGGQPLYASEVLALAIVAPLAHFTAARRTLRGFRAVRAREGVAGESPRSHPT